MASTLDAVTHLPINGLRVLSRGLRIVSSKRVVCRPEEPRQRISCTPVGGVRLLYHHDTNNCEYLHPFNLCDVALSCKDVQDFHSIEHGDFEPINLLPNCLNYKFQTRS